MKIYTKIGDKGTTKLVDGSWVEKFNPRVEAYGSVDELNSQLGVVRSLILSENNSEINQLDRHIEVVQNQLFSVGSLLAAGELDIFKILPQIEEKHISQIENWIDAFSAPLPELKNFILPAGNIIAAQLHMSRTICRRAERRCSEIYIKEAHYNFVFIYLNRLSDLFFTWARWINFKKQVPEAIWKKENV